jgi:hypothetical protein
MEGALFWRSCTTACEILGGGYLGMTFYGESWGNGGGSSLNVNLDNLIAFVVIILAHFL